MEVTGCKLPDQLFVFTPSELLQETEDVGKRYNANNELSGKV